ncbi:hypothetical protein O181_037850 [Austropuccinia psidii MF-1]|uniref:Uncharacterized protein n=1 Tax=Austropuccinia psidii MF-1 TaxID=1389203 RepID=A0A9Q3D8X3_9BASI|nr:hypothetical protein [Austropuccinia psidii MF-1]
MPRSLSVIISQASGYDPMREDNRALLPPVHSSSPIPPLFPELSGVQVLRSPNLLNLPQLSPLVQRTPASAKLNIPGKSDWESKVYNEFTSDDAGLDKENQRHGLLNDVANPKWANPAERLGLSTFGTLLLVALAIMGIFIILGKTTNGVDRLGKSFLSSQNSSLGTGLLSTNFSFSPSYYLQHCTVKTGSVQVPESPHDVSSLTNYSQLSSHELGLDSTYFSLTPGQQLVENKRLYSKTDSQGEKICNKTLTYLLDDDFGFTFHLNAITFAAALAKNDSRAFFIVDAEWDRDLWTTYFKTLPDPGCSPPPPTEMVGCPRGSRHWIVTSSILSYHFSDAILQPNFGNNQAVDQKIQTAPVGIIPYTRQPIYDMAREAFSKLFILTTESQRLIHETKQAIIASQVWSSGVDGQLPPYISVHIRKGDRHPYDPSHKFDYIPIMDYIDTINSTWRKLRDLDNKLPENPNIYLASDTPLSLDQFQAMTPKSWRSFHLSRAGPKNLSGLAHPHEYAQSHFHAHSVVERVEFTKGQLIDMAFLAGGWPNVKGSIELSPGNSEKPVSVICTASSNMCQFAALQLGWEDAFEKSKWINIDMPLLHKWEGIEIPAPNTGDSDPNGGGHGSGHTMHGAHK